MNIYVYSHVHVCVYMRVHMCEHVCGGSRLMFRVFLIILYFSHGDRVSQSNSEFASKPSLASRLVLGIHHLCHLDTGITDAPSCPSNIYVGSGHSDFSTFDCMTNTLPLSHL